MCGCDEGLEVRSCGAAELGHGKVELGHQWGSAKAERGHRWSAGKRSAVATFDLSDYLSKLRRDLVGAARKRA